MAARKSRLWFLLTLAAAAFLLYLSLRGIQWHVVAQIIRGIQPSYGLAAMALGVVPMLLRAARWRILLQAEAPVSYSTTFWAVAAGYFGNNFLPARGGELVRSCIVRDRSRLSLTYVLATALSERVADAVALVLIGSISLAFMPHLKLVRGSFAVIGCVGVIGLALLPKFAKPLDEALRRWPRAQRVAQQILLGVGSFHDGSRLLGFAALTIPIWLIDAGATSLLAYSMAIPMSVSLALLLIVALSLSSALPSTPGYVGIYQFVAVMVLKPFGISPSAAIAFVLVTQAMSYAVTGFLGLLAVTWFTPFRWTRRS